MAGLDDLSTLITTSWEENTIVWIVISGAIGGILTQFFKFIFERTIPEWQRKKATRVAIQKYSYPISQSATTLISTIKNILDNPDQVNDQRHKLNAIYDFACFFGWIQILLNESFEEGLETPQNLRRYEATARYLNNLNSLISDITNDSYRSYMPYQTDLTSEVLGSLTIPRWTFSVIGELMISYNVDSNSPTVISRVEFAQKYEDASNTKKWFESLDSLLLGLQKSKFNYQWNMLVSICVFVCIFVANISKKQPVIPSEWIPVFVRQIFYPILWLPLMIKKYILIIRFLVLSYRTDRKSFQIVVESLTGRGRYAPRIQQETRRPQDGHESFQLQPTTKIVVTYNEDNLKHNTRYIPKNYPNDPKYYFDKGVNDFVEMWLSALISPYLLEYYLLAPVLSNLKFRLEVNGYLSSFNHPYYERFSYLEKVLGEDQKNAYAWNEKGILCACLEGWGQDVGYDAAIKCFDIATSEHPEYMEAWTNKGLAYLGREGYGYKEMDCRNAIECFERALSLAQKDSRTSFEDLADIHNNLGICNYELGDHAKSIDCFDKALEINKRFVLPQENKKIIENITTKRKLGSPP